MFNRLFLWIFGGIDAELLQLHVERLSGELKGPEEIFGYSVPCRARVFFDGCVSQWMASFGFWFCLFGVWDGLDGELEF